MGFNAITDFFSTLYGVIVIIITVSGAVIGIIALLLDYRNDRRARDTFSIERRRLTEVNVRIRHFVKVALVRPPATVTPTQETAGAYVALHLPLKNIGDGPIDILGMLASGRVLAYEQWQKGIGTRSRDVEWDDYQTYYWNGQYDHGNLFSGISTTKHLINKADNYTRFAAKESGIMRRIDAVRDVTLLRRQDEATVMYRLFTVARGYSLGEILRQLGGGPPDPALNVTTELLQFQRLAQPNYRRWQCVQQALINLNRFAFRLAIYDPQKPAESADPLGLLADADAWRIFLLHHWEFVDDLDDAAPRDLAAALVPVLVDDPALTEPVASKGKFIIARDSMQHATERLKKDFYPTLSLPDTWQTDPAEQRRFDAARQVCHSLLLSHVAAWGRLKAAIAQCKDNTTPGKTPRNYPNEGYPRLIHLDRSYRERWLALMKEGYLISKPFPRNWFKLYKLGIGHRRGYTFKDIPNDPRALEPYVMRTYYFLESVGLSQERDIPED